MDSATAKPLLTFLLAASYFAFITYAENGNSHSPVVAPTHPPIHPPVHPPVGPPVHPPSHPPVHPPIRPPVHPPALPPNHPPVHPPVGPPVHPPSHPPVHPPVRPPSHSPVHPPSHPPVRPPVHPPVHPPARPPVHPPVHPPIHPPAPHHPPAYPPEHHHIYPRSLVAVEGAVFCQSCKNAGQNNLSGASPIPGAVVKLECRNTAKLTTLTAITNERGYFYIQTHNVTTYGYDKCRAYLVSSPLATCNQPTNVLDGLTGAELHWYQQFYLFKVPYMIFTVGPFAFLPKCG